MEAAVGGIFAGYVIEGVLGRGGMGTVYLAQHPRLPRSVALKLLNQDVAADPELRARFEREATLVARLDHPGIVAVQDRGIQDGQPWLAMQYIQGTDASRLEPGALSVERAIRIVGEVAAALDYAHSQGVLHRDVKPANILLTTAEAGRVERAVLTDFGIGRLLGSDTQLTSTGTFIATLAYGAPEQLSGDRVDARSDQYSLACTLYALLTGQAPFPGTDPGQVVTGHLIKPVPLITRTDVPPGLNAVIARAMAKNPAERFASAGEFAAAATAALARPVGAAVPTMQNHRSPGSGPATLYTGGYSPPPVPAYAGGPNPWGAVCALVAGFFLIGLSASSFTTAYPMIMRDLAATSAMMSWLSAGAAVALTTPLLVAGRLGDRFGPKNIYLAGLVVLILASAVGVVSASIWMLALAHLAQGLAAGLMLPQTLAVIIRVFTPDRRGAALGLWVGAGGLGSLLGPAVGAMVVERLGWRCIFLIDIPIGLLALVLAALLLPRLPGQRLRPDPIGLLLAGVAVLLVTTGIAMGTTDRIAEPVWIGVLAAGVVVFGLFVLSQTRPGADRLVPAGMLRDRTVVLSTVAAASACAVLGSTMVLLSFHLPIVHGFSPFKTAFVLVPGAVIAAVCAPLAGLLADRTHPALIPAIGFASFGAAVLGFAALMSSGAPLLALLAMSVLAGLAMACTWAPLAATATRFLPIPWAGVGAGIHLTARQIGTLIGTLVAATVFAQAMNSGMGRSDAIDAAVWTVSLATLGFVLLGGIAAVLLTRRPSVSAGPPEHLAETLHGSSFR
ncbi:MDR family MFS transporter [Nocardia sp. NPDC051832]|uniref:MDR family MFS transporter n=1 Tax=Nocardia sp. NPDC051832 TaxID=3155673 RepID=UPI0034145FA0